MNQTKKNPGIELARELTLARLPDLHIALRRAQTRREEAAAAAKSSSRPQNPSSPVIEHKP